MSVLFFFCNIRPLIKICDPGCDNVSYSRLIMSVVTNVSSGRLIVLAEIHFPVAQDAESLKRETVHCVSIFFLIFSLIFLIFLKYFLSLSLSKRVFCPWLSNSGSTRLLRRTQ